MAAGTGAELSHSRKPLATLDRLQTTAQLVAKRPFGVEVPLLQHRQPVAAEETCGKAAISFASATAPASASAGHDPVGQADVGRFARTDRPAREDQVHGPGFADQPRQPDAAEIKQRQPVRREKIARVAFSAITRRSAQRAWLDLQGEGRPRVRAARKGRWIRMSVTGQRGHRSLDGLSGLRSLTLRTRRVSFDGLSGYRNLRSLWVYGRFATLEHLDALRELTSLQALLVHDAYVFDAEELPRARELPSLEHVVFDGFPREAKATIEERLAGVARLDLRQPRSAAWVEENRSNPFREWADDDECLGKAATAAWKKARAAVRQLGPKAKRTDARKVLETFVVVFNRFEIDTGRREEACDAFHNLARGLGVPEDRAQDWSTSGATSRL